MTERLRSRLLVQALIRRTEAEGGFATVLRKGDDISGAILLQCPDENHHSRLFERVADFEKGYTITPVAVSSWGDEERITQYLDRRCHADPDLWVIELDVPNGEQLAAAMLTGD